MNTQLLRKIADQIEAEPERYDQTVWIDNLAIMSGVPGETCGTRACIAGWAVMLSKTGRTHGTIKEAAGGLLRLTERESEELFSAGFMEGRESEVPAVLRRFADNDKIDFDRSIR